MVNLEQASGNKSLQSLFSRNSRGYITMYNNGAVDANTSEEGYSNRKYYIIILFPYVLERREKFTFR